MNLLTIRQMQYLVALAQEGSFSRAAERCYVTQSTLSAGIKEAETLLGRALINREKRAASLTNFGHDILPDVQEILNKAQVIALRARQYDAPMSAPIRLGIIPTIAPYLLPRLLPALQTRFPQLDIQIFEDLSPHLSEMLRRGQIDLILYALPYETLGAEQFPLFEEAFYMAQPASQEPPKGGHYKVDELDNDHLLLLAEGHCLTDHALQACRLQRQAHGADRYSASSLTTLIQMVSHGMGRTLLPEMVVKAQALPDKMRCYPFAQPAPKRTIGLAWLEGSARRDDFVTLADVIVEYAAD